VRKREREEKVGEGVVVRTESREKRGKEAGVSAFI
jgi:hypothetical protein